MLFGVFASDCQLKDMKHMHKSKENPSYLFVKYFHDIKGGQRQITDKKNSATVKFQQPNCQN